MEQEDLGCTLRDGRTCLECSPRQRESIYIGIMSNAENLDW